jgi:hypothetical protein
MTKRRACSLAPLLVAAILAAAPAAAATRFSAFAARWATRDAGAAFGGGVRVGVPLGDRLTVDLRASAYERRAAGPLARLGGADNPFTDGLRAVPLDVGFRLDLARRDILNPYLGAGGSYVLLDSDAGRVDDEVGWYVLAGVELGKLFLEGDYRRIEATVDPGPIRAGDLIDPGPRVGVDLSGFAFHAGWIWKF